MRGRDFPRGIEFDQNKHKNILIDKAYEQAVESLEDEDPINPKEFTNYDPAMIEDDLKYVDRMKKVFEQSDAQLSLEQKRDQKLGLIFEVIIHEQAELNEWLGANVSTRKASDFDDIRNGVDSIAEFKHDIGSSHLALAIDVTRGNPAKKMERIKEEIDNEQLSEVKYFESSDETFKGSLKKVPRVVIGADRESILKLAEQWTKNDRKGLAVNSMQLQILDEIKAQLETFMAYAENKGKRDIAKIYRGQLSLINEIRRGKEKLYKTPGMQDYKKNDRVYEALLRQLDIFTK